MQQSVCYACINTLTHAQHACVHALQTHAAVHAPPIATMFTFECGLRMPGISSDSRVGRVLMENNPAVSPLRMVLATGRFRALGSVYPTGLCP